MEDILSLSKRLRDKRKSWKGEAHWNRNRNRNPVDQQCRKCGHLPDSKKCVQSIPVQENALKYSLKNHLIIPEEGDAIGPVVC